MISILIFTIIAAIASVCHGADKLQKPIIILAQAAAVGVICGAQFIPFALAWWVCFRRGTHARAELDYIRGVGSLAAVKAAYPLPIGIVATWIVGYCQHHRWAFLSERRQQELLLALLLTAPVCAFIPAILSI